jgi:pimeloyl-ACP methyl ester carboxylesterase
VHVGEHAALGRQPGRITAGPGGQRLDIVCQKTLEVRSAVLAGDRDLAARPQRSDGDAFVNRSVVVGRGLIRFHSSEAHVKNKEMPVLYCIWAIVLLLAAPAAAQQAQQAQQPAEGTTGYTIFARGEPIGREDVEVQRTTAGATTIISRTRLGPPVNLLTRRAEVRYRADGSPESVYIDAQLNGQDVKLETTFANGVATTKGNEGGTVISEAHQVSPQTIVLPNLLFGVYEAVGRRLVNMQAGGELRAYIVPQVEIPIRVGNITTQRIQTGTTTFDVRRYELVFVHPQRELAVTLAVDERGGLVSVNLPAQGLDVVRDDVSSPTSRTLLYSHAADEPVTIPASGFNLGATLTRPKAAAGARSPAVILLGGSAVADRDGLGLGIPTIGQLAGALADAGSLAVRYDKRGYGQSGGRSESATLSDYAEDARSVFTWLRNRRDVDPNRIAILGHSDGAWVAFLAASRERRFAGVVSVAAPSITGSELVLEQQRYMLDQTKAPDRDAKIELQQRINTAVITGKGWEGLPDDVRRQADTPWFQSLLTFDPARVIRNVRQPLLFVHGDLDRQVPVEHVNRLSELARKEARSRSIEVVTVRGVNHLLVPATTGHTSEYASLPDRNLSKDVSSAVATWLDKTFKAVDN